MINHDRPIQADNAHFPDLRFQKKWWNSHCTSFHCYFPRGSSASASWKEVQKRLNSCWFVLMFIQKIIQKIIPKSFPDHGRSNARPNVDANLICPPAMPRTAEPRNTGTAEPLVPLCPARSSAWFGTPQLLGPWRIGSGEQFSDCQSWRIGNLEWFKGGYSGFSWEFSIGMSASVFSWDFFQFVIFSNGNSFFDSTNKIQGTTRWARIPLDPSGNVWRLRRLRRGISSTCGRWDL